jgi:3-phosphoshikimate 1-carboxyvinyltransferase
MALAVVRRSTLQVRGLVRGDPHPDLALLEDLATIGLQYDWQGDGTLRLDGRGVVGSGERRVFTELGARPDAVVPLAIALASVPGTHELRGLGNLRNKESDRLAALAENLRRAGVATLVVGDDLMVDGTELGRLPVGSEPAVIEVANDHRIAMGFSVLATARAGGLRIGEPGSVAKSWPGFFAALVAACPGCSVVEGPEPEPEPEPDNGER